MATKYVARIDGKIVGNRTTKDRTYTHAIVLFGHGKSEHVVTWCGRLDLAHNEQRKYQRYGYRAEIVPAEVVVPREKPTFRSAGKAPRATRKQMNSHLS